jgi:type I restriction enzyme S subunit
MEFMPESDYEGWMVRGLPDSGDVLVTTEAPLGEVAQIEDTRVALAQRIILLKANKQKVTNEYLKYFFLSAAGQGELWTRASGSTAIGIKASKFKGLTIVVPPINEQREIVRHLDCEMEKLHQLRSVVTISLGKLTEYRSALISAAVAGQIDVRKYRSQEATASCQ